MSHALMAPKLRETPQASTTQILDVYINTHPLSLLFSPHIFVALPSSSMSDPNNNRPPREESEEPFTNTNARFPSLFDTLWSLPSTIYQRGNEHGREFNRMFDERRQERSDRENEQEREDGRASRACGWRGRRWHRENEEKIEEQGRRIADANKNKNDVDMAMGEWVNKVVKELERGEKEAKELYDEWWRKMEDDAQPKHQTTLPPFEQVSAGKNEMQPTEILQTPKDRLEARRMMRARQAEEAQHRDQEEYSEREENTWANIFPAWSNREHTDQNDDKKLHEHIFNREQPRNRPLTSAARDVEDTFDKFHQDFERWVGATSQLGQFFHNGYMRDSKLWEEEGLFGPSVPFSRPLSTIFSLGMRPFLPQESAMAYLLYSEYSPLHLENEKGFDASFRRRFEDLVRVQGGGEIITKGNEERVGTKVEWIGRIVPLLKEGDGESKASITFGIPNDKQATLAPIEEPPQTPLRAEPSALAKAPQQTRTSDDPETELDTYEQHFGNLPRAGVEHPAPAPHIPGSSNILSTLTTTERRTASDGSTTIKTVLKRRFADGREETESSESVETGRTSALVHTTPRLRHPELQESKTAAAVEVEAKGGKGWFWSS
jgi:hypothetical protein